MYKIMQHTRRALHCTLGAGTRALRRCAPGSAWDAGDLYSALPLQHLGAKAAHVCHKPQVVHHLRRAAQSSEGHSHTSPELHHMHASLTEVLRSCCSLHQQAGAAQATHTFKHCKNAAGDAAIFVVRQITCSMHRRAHGKSQCITPHAKGLVRGCCASTAMRCYLANNADEHMHNKRLARTFRARLPAASAAVTLRPPKRPSQRRNRVFLARQPAQRTASAVLTACRVAWQACHCLSVPRAAGVRCP